jgi:SAM-dependent methyltransferase
MTDRSGGGLSEEWLVRDQEVKALDPSGSLGTTGRYWINQHLGPFARRYFPEALRVLDLGCGDGGYLALLRQAGFRGRYLGVDLQRSPLWDTRQGEGGALQAEFRALDAHRVGELGERFNAMVSVTALEHFRDDRAVLSGVAEVLEPGARALIVVPSPYGNFVWGFDHGHRKYTPTRLRQALTGLPLTLLEAVPAGALPSLVVNGLWVNGARGLGTALRYATYLRYLGDRQRAKREQPWVLDIVGELQFAHLRSSRGKRLHARLNQLLLGLDERARVCPTQWLFVLERHG